MLNRLWIDSMMTRIGVWGVESLMDRLNDDVRCQLRGFGDLEMSWSRRRALSNEPGLASQLRLEPELGSQT